MRDEDLLQCPLFKGLDAVRRAELLGMMKDSNLREKVETCVTRQMADNPELAPGCAESSHKRDFQKDVHTWNPQVPMWRRSPKE